MDGRFCRGSNLLGDFGEGDENEGDVDEGDEDEGDEDEGEEDEGWVEDLAQQIKENIQEIPVGPVVEEPMLLKTRPLFNRDPFLYPDYGWPYRPKRSLRPPACWAFRPWTIDTAHVSTHVSPARVIPCYPGPLRHPMFPRQKPMHWPGMSWLDGSLWPSSQPVWLAGLLRPPSTRLRGEPPQERDPIFDTPMFHWGDGSRAYLWHQRPEFYL